MAYSWPLSQVGEKYLLTFVGSLLNQRTMTQMVYRVKTYHAGDTIGDICNQLISGVKIINLLMDKYLACMPGNYTLVAIWAQQIALSRYAKVTSVEAEAGTAGQPANTANVAAVVTRRAVEAGRFAVSNLHLPAPTTDSWIEDGMLTADAKTALTAFGVESVNNITLSGGSVLEPVIFRGPERTAGIVLGQSEVQDTVRVMRRRTVRIGI